MIKHLCLEQRMFSPLLVLLFLTLIVVSPASAQQNGTDCAEQIPDGPNTLTLYLGATCDGMGQPYYNPEQPDPGEGDTIAGCYSSNNGNYGLDAICDPCPSNWQNCTPCPNDALTCDEDTPDPPPGPGGSNLVPQSLRNATYALVSAIDWLTA